MTASADGAFRLGYGYAESLPPAAPVSSPARPPRFDELIELHRRDLSRYVARRVPDAALAEDIVQETLLRAYRARKAFDRGRPLWPWLSTIANNTIANARRRERLRRRHTEGTLDWRTLEDIADRRVGADPETRFASKEEGTAIRQALDELTHRQRRLLLMRAVDGLGYAEIATGEGLTLDAVKSLVKRARRIFRDSYARIREDAAPAAIPPTLGRMVASVRLRWARVRVRSHSIACAVRWPVDIESLAEMLGAMTVAGALVLSGFAANRNPSAPVPVRLPRLSPAVHARTSAMTEDPAVTEPSPGRPLIAESVGTPAEGPPAEVTVGGRIEHESTDRRTVRIRIRYEVPGTDQGVNTYADVPCTSDDLRAPYCKALDAAAGP